MMHPVMPSSTITRAVTADISPRPDFVIPAPKEARGRNGAPGLPAACELSSPHRGIAARVDGES